MNKSQREQPADEPTSSGAKLPPMDAAFMAKTAHDYQNLWLLLAQNKWKALVLAPVDPDASVIETGRLLTNAGSPLSEHPVTFLSLTDPLEVDHDGTPGPERARTKTIVNRIRSMRQTPDSGQLVIAIQPVTVEPLGVLIARAADVVVLCVTMGKSRKEDVDRSVTLIGPDRIVGCVLLE